MNLETVNLDRYLVKSIMKDGWLETFFEDLERKHAEAQRDELGGENDARKDEDSTT